MDIAKLQEKLLKQNEWLFMKLSEQKKLVIDSAQTEHDYRIAVAIKVLELRSEGVPVTIISDITRGDKVIANLKLQRDIARGMSDSCNQAIQAIRASMSGLQSLISRDKEAMKLI